MQELPVLEWRPFAWISLIDMVRYGVRDLHALLLWIERTIEWTFRQERDSQELTETDRSRIYEQARCLAKHCESLELPDTSEACSALMNAIDEVKVSEVRGYLSSIRHVITRRLDERIFIYVPKEYERFAPPLKKRTPFRSDILAPSTKPPYTMGLVATAFGDARYDIEQIALCTMAGASTATVFHTMRVVEYGVRAFAHDLGIHRIKQVNGKTGKFKLIPVEYATWELLSGTLNTKIEKTIKKLRPGPSKQEKQEFYGSLMQDFKEFKDAWRNHVMHGRATYSQNEASMILVHVERFMGRICGKNQKQ